MERLRIEPKEPWNSKTLKNYLMTHGVVFKDQWNEPYLIAKDYKLTLHKYLEYCKANNKDIKSFYNFMDSITQN